MIQIPQSTARRVMLKLFLTGTTTAATGKTLAIVLSKAGAAFGNPSVGATNATELTNGWYYVDLSTTDAATLGDLIVRGTSAACDDSERCFAVVAATNAGLTALPAVAAEAAGGLFTRGAGAGQINQAANGQVDVNISTAGGVSWNSGAIVRNTLGADTGLVAFRSNTAQAGAAGSITLDASASAVNDTFKGCRIILTSGTGANQSRLCTAYDGTTKIASVSPNWATNPASGTLFLVMPAGGVEFVAGAVGSVTGLNASNLDVEISSRMASYTQPTGFLGATFPSDPADESLIIAATDAIMTRIGAAGASLTAVRLASDGLDAIATTAPAGVAANFREMIVSVWRWFYRKNIYDSVGSTIKTYADDGTTVVTTATATDVAGVETKGPAS